MSFPANEWLSDLQSSVCLYVRICIRSLRSYVLYVGLSPTASALVQRMLSYFYTTLWPAFRGIRRSTTTSLGGVTVRGGTASRPQLGLPLFVPPELREPHVATPRPIMPRDSSSFRVQSNPYSVSEPSSWPVVSTYAVPGLPGSAP